MVDRDGANVDKLRKVIFVRHVVTMPCDYIERTMVLLALEELAPKLVDDIPWVVISHSIACYRVEEIASVGQSVGTEGAEFRELKAGTIDLKNVTSGRTFNLDFETLTTLDDADFSRLDIEMAKLSLYVQGTLLGHNEKIAIRIDKSAVLHAFVAQENMSGQALSKSLVARTCDSFQTIDKVHSLLGGYLKWISGQLSGRDMDPRIVGEKSSLGVYFVWQFRLELEKGQY